MTSLKNLTVLKNSSNNSKQENNSSDHEMSYHNRGFGNSKGAQGNVSNLKASLNALFQSYRKEM